MIAKTKIMTNRTYTKANWNNDACLMSLTYIQLQPRGDGGDVKRKLCKKDIMEEGICQRIFGFSSSGLKQVDRNL